MSRELLDVDILHADEVDDSEHELLCVSRGFFAPPVSSPFLDVIDDDGMKGKEGVLFPEVGGGIGL